VKTTLEERIVAALSSTTITATELLALAGEVDVAILEADETASAERERALDPVASPDVAKAREAMENAALVRDRLRTVLPRLWDRQRAAEAAEHAARWEQDYVAVEAQTAALAAELAELYPMVVTRLTDLLGRIADNDRERSRIAGRAAAGEPRRVTGAEVRARGYFSTGRASLAQEVRLPAWEEAKLAWPRPKPSMAAVFAATVPFNPKFTHEWHRHTAS
jgi:hypothetical protein